LTSPKGSVGDNFGSSVALSADGNTAIVGAINEDVGFNLQQGTATVFVRNGAVWTAQQKLTLSSGATRARFGSPVAISGDGNTAVFGVDSTASGRGSVVIFTRSGGVWTQQQQWTAADGAAGDGLGISVAVSSDGNTILVGAYLDDLGASVNQGSAYVFVLHSRRYMQ